MNILVTGTSGYIGSIIKESLLSAGENVFSIEGRTDFKRKAHEILEQTSIEVVIHAGFNVDFGPFNPKILSPSVENTQSLIQLAEKFNVEYFIFMSAAGIVGCTDSHRPLSEADIATFDNAYNAYANTQYIHDKTRCEKLLKDSKLVSASLLLTTVYGKKMNRNIIRPLLDIAQGKSIQICPPGGTSFLLEEDFLKALKIVLNHKPQGQFILNSQNISYKKMFDLASQYSSKKKTFIITLPRFFKYLFALLSKIKTFDKFNISIIVSSFGHKCFSSKKAHDILGWSPQGTLKNILDEALEQNGKST